MFRFSRDKLEELFISCIGISTLLTAFVLIPLMIYVTSDAYIGWIPDIVLTFIMLICIIPYALYALYGVAMMIYLFIKNRDVFLIILGYSLIGVLFLLCIAFSILHFYDS